MTSVSWILQPSSRDCEIGPKRKTTVTTLNLLTHPACDLTERCLETFGRGVSGWPGHLYDPWCGSYLIYSGGSVALAGHQPADDSCVAWLAKCFMITFWLIYGRELYALPHHVVLAIFQVWRALGLHLYGSSGLGQISLITTMTYFFAALSPTWVWQGDAASGLDWSFSETPSNRVRLCNHPPRNVGGCQTGAMLMMSWMYR